MIQQNPLVRSLLWLERHVTLPDDNPGDRLKKTGAVIVEILSGFTSAATTVAMVLGGNVPVSIFLGFAALAGLGSVLYVIRTQRFRVFLYSFITINFVTAMLIHTAVGGFTHAMVLTWASTGVVASALFLSRRETAILFGLFAFMLTGMLAADPLIRATAPGLAVGLGTFLTYVSILCPMGMIVVVISFVVQELDSARGRADDLLLSILPGPIAEQLKQNRGTIADGYSEVTVLFADIAGFTAMSDGADPVAVVTMLNGLFSDFDDLAAKHGLEKIKTIGDAYMVAGGIPEPRPDHAEVVAAFAVDMLDCIKHHRGLNGDPVAMRIGINTGPVVAGVIGRQKFIYDLWGDAVNTASRMESNGVPNRIQVTAATYEKLKDRYTFKEREPIYIKGKGEMVTYWMHSV